MKSWIGAQEFSLCRHNNGCMPSPTLRHSDLRIKIHSRSIDHSYPVHESRYVKISLCAHVHSLNQIFKSRSFPTLSEQDPKSIRSAPKSNVKKATYSYGILHKAWSSQSTSTAVLRSQRLLMGSIGTPTQSTSRPPGITKRPSFYLWHLKVESQRFLRDFVLVQCKQTCCQGSWLAAPNNWESSSSEHLYTSHCPLIYSNSS